MGGRWVVHGWSMGGRWVVDGWSMGGRRVVDGRTHQPPLERGAAGGPSQPTQRNETPPYIYIYIYIYIYTYIHILLYMAIHLWLHMAIYMGRNGPMRGVWTCMLMAMYFRLSLGVSTCILGVWTCIWVLELGWTCILGVWTCIWVSGLVSGVSGRVLWILYTCWVSAYL